MIPYLESIKYVTGPLTLAAFLAVIFLAVIYRVIRPDGNLTNGFLALFGSKFTKEAFFEVTKTVLFYSFFLCLFLMFFLLLAFLVPQFIHHQGPTKSGVDGSSLKPKELEVVDLGLAEDYEKKSLDGELPTFDLKLRNPSPETAYVKEIKFNILKRWVIKPFDTATSIPYASVQAPTGIYDIEPNASTEPEVLSGSPLTLELKPQDEGQVFIKKVSHQLKPNETDRVLLRFAVKKIFEHTDRNTGERSRFVMVTPFYVYKINVTVVYNENNSTAESKEIIFLDYYNKVNERFLPRADSPVFEEKADTELRRKSNLEAMDEIDAAKCPKSPSLPYIFAKFKAIKQS